MTPAPTGGTTRPGRWELAGLVAIMAVILSIGVWACCGPEERLAFLLYDDAYYYLGVARNLAHGLGSTFDGINPSNGYHPLWCWLLVPIFLVVDSPGIAIRIVGLLWYGLAAGAICALWWAMRPRSGAIGAVAAAALFGLHPFLGLQLSRPNGLETPLYALLLALFLGAFERSLAVDRAPPGARRMTLLGGLLGAVILSRLDGGMLSIAAMILLVVGLGRGGRWKAALPGLAALVLAATVVAAPALIWNAVRFGSPMPMSGRVFQVYAEEARQDLGGSGSLRYWQRRAWHAVESIPIQVGRTAVGGAAALQPFWRLGKPAGTAVLLTVMLVTGCAIRRRTRGRPARGDALALLALTGLIQYVVYTGWLWVGGEKGFRLYYFMPQCMLVASGIGTLFGGALGRIRRPAALRRGAAAAALTLLAAFLLIETADRFSRTRSEAGPLAERRVYGWIRHHLPSTAVLATTDAGLLGFFSGRPTVNLDGLINDQRFLEALRKKEVPRYVHDSPITHLVAGIGALHGYDPERPEIPPDPPDPMGSLLYELGRIPGCRLRQVGSVENWLIFEVSRGG